MLRLDRTQLSAGRRARGRRCCLRSRGPFRAQGAAVVALVANLKDPSDLEPGCSFGEFIDEGVLQRWADGWSFNLAGINEVHALFHLVFTFLVPSIEELPNNLYKDVMQVRKGKRRPETLPSYTLRVDGAAIRHFLVETYDGPFNSEDSLMGAMLLRSVL